MTPYLKNEFFLIMEKLVKLKRKRAAGLLGLLAIIIIIVGLLSSSCVSGLSPIGWSGGIVENDTLYIGSVEGRLAAINMIDESRQWAETLKQTAQTGMFGCSALTGGCGGGSNTVAIYGTPVVSDNLVYIAGYNGKVYAYRADNLAQRWIYPREGNIPPVVGGMVLSQGKLYFGCSDGKVEGKKVKGMIFVLDAETGDKLATFETGDRVWGTPAVDGNTVYIGSFDKNLYALDKDTLAVKWQYTTEGSIISTPLIYNGLVYFGSFDRNLYAVNAANGALKWKYMGQNWFWTRPEIINSTIYAGCLDGLIYILQADTGKEIKIYDISQEFKESKVKKSPLSSQPVVIDNSIIFANSKGVIVSVDTGNNSIHKIAVLDNASVYGPLTAYNGMIYLQTQKAELQRINAASGAVTSISLKS
jgi:outer membrane protein assembly factor BamB